MDLHLLSHCAGISVIVQETAVVSMYCYNHGSLFSAWPSLLRISSLTPQANTYSDFIRSAETTTSLLLSARICSRPTVTSRLQLITPSRAAMQRATILSEESTRQVCSITAGINWQ